ncbi:Abi family protein [Leuconostoc mesenteroides]|uniref:Abi family protein n=1 Tax=Leuconostoc mesenteroides TaxID=1245 RepID=UPI000FFCDD7F|nr:Abi family protein [Leuconostoc mesenteroides]QAR69697.1 Abi family protein [Leuconostoc mesenteroides]WJM73569.1 Abi family protein [Leuconostoc mesenteroides]
MGREDKPKKSYLELIDHMKDKGITFNIMSEEDAELFLSSKNYYFKSTSYRSNFPKLNDKYLNLDFAYLVDFSAMDANLRRYLSDITLGVEHALKVRILNIIQNNASEDGYTIVDEFKQKHPKAYQTTLDYLANNRYSLDLFNKHHDDPAIWVLVEVMPFGPLSQFIEFYGFKYNHRELKNIVRNMKFAKNIRNAVAHSNPLLLNLFSEKEYIPHPTQAIVHEASNMDISSDLVSDMKIHDLVALFHLNKLLISKEARKHNYDDGQAVIARLSKHPDYYMTLAPFKQFISIFNKLLDYQRDN